MSNQRDFTSAKAKEALLPDKEEKCCGGCCWFYAEDTDGWGLCCKRKYCDSMHCSYLCTTDEYVGNRQMRHYMAVLLQANRYRRDPNVPAIHKMPRPTELGKAIDFAIEYMKVFGEL